MEGGSGDEERLQPTSKVTKKAKRIKSAGQDLKSEIVMVNDDATILYNSVFGMQTQISGIILGGG